MRANLVEKYSGGAVIDCRCRLKIRSLLLLQYEFQVHTTFKALCIYIYISIMISLMGPHPLNPWKKHDNFDVFKRYILPIA